MTRKATAIHVSIIATLLIAVCVFFHLKTTKANLELQSALSISYTEERYAGSPLAIEVYENRDDFTRLAAIYSRETGVEDPFGGPSKLVNGLTNGKYTAYIFRPFNVIGKVQ